MDTIKNVQIYGLEESIRASKFPMAVDTDKCTSEITERTISLGSAATGTGHDNFLKGIKKFLLGLLLTRDKMNIVY